MASICKLFYKDLVWRVKKKIENKNFFDVGVVKENADPSDDDNYYGTKVMDKGYVGVAWYPRGLVKIAEDKVKLCDRSLMPGDVVRKIVKGKDTQLGYCRNIDVKTDVHVIGTEKVIVGVDSKDLIPMEEFVSNVAVFKDSWVGLMKNFKTELTLRCSDGSRCIMSVVDAYYMDDVLDRRERESGFKKYSFYPGQRLWGATYCFNKVQWLNITRSMSDKIKQNISVLVMVEEVKIISAHIEWVCKADRSAQNPVVVPKNHVSGEDLKSIKMMNIFKPCTLQIGDRNFLIMKENFEVLSLDEFMKHLSSRLDESDYNSPLHKQTKSNKASTDTKDNCVDANANCNNIENIWDDNCDDFEDIEDEESGKSSDTASVTSRFTASSVDIGSSGPKKRKKSGTNCATKLLKMENSVHRPDMKHMKETLPFKPGEKLNTKTVITETRADVVWQDGTVEHNILSTSLYPVHTLDGHEFFPGDYVVHSKETRPYEYGVVKQVDHTEKTALITWMKIYQAGGDPHPEVLSEEEVSVYAINYHPDFIFGRGSHVIRVGNSEDSNPASSAGQVVEFHSTGKVEVAWISGETSLCYPQKLYTVELSYDPWFYESYSYQEDSLETESEKSVLGNEEELGDKDLDGTTKDLEKVSIKLEEKDDDKSTEDRQAKLPPNIEGLRAGMERLEEVFTQNPTLQPCNVMRRLLELYKQSKVLDQSLGTAILVERFSIDHRADQIFRFFSSSEANFEKNETQSKEEINMDFDKETVNESSRVDMDILIDSPVGDAPLLTNSSICNEGMSNRKPLLSPISPTSGNGSEPRNLCQQLCAILKSRLLKAYEDEDKNYRDAQLHLSVSHSAIFQVYSALLATETELLSNGILPEEAGANEATSSVLTSDIKENDTEKPPLPNTEEDVAEVNSVGQGTFSMLESVPDRHHYKLSISQPADPCAFFRIVTKEVTILRSSLPEGIVVKSFEDRMDLFSVLIKGPKRTPYEDGLFFFDFQFPADYPKVPPLCHYISYCSDRLNPNLYEDGNVCVSLLGTWGGDGTEKWNPETSSLLQVIVSIQGLILVPEPYYNEPGYERQKGTQLGEENNKMYNENAVLKLVEAMTKLLLNPPEMFKQEITEHFQTQASKLTQRLERWLAISENWNSEHPASPTSPSTSKELHNCDTSAQDVLLPEFPLMPASKGFCLALRKSLAEFKGVLSSSSIVV